MKNKLSKFLFMLSFASLFVACEKDAELTSQKDVFYPTSPAVTSSVASLVLTEAIDSSNVITFTWPSVNFEYTDKVTYSLQFDVPADTISGTPWSKATTIFVGEKILTKSFLGTDINKMAKDLGCPTKSLSPLVIRVCATVDRNVYSAPITVTVKPYKKAVVVTSALWIAGDFQIWNFETAPYITPYIPALPLLPNNNLYEGYIYIPAGSGLEYKMYGQPDALPTSYGDAGSGALVQINADGSNFKAPSEGYYEISADLGKMKWTQTKTTWGIIGDATPGAWTTDTEMTYDATNQVWTVTCDLLNTGSFKFRANKDWKIDFGIDANGKLKYVDNPLFTYDSTNQNLTVAVAGNYTITLDLHTPGDYNYTLKKN